MASTCWVHRVRVRITASAPTGKVSIVNINIVGQQCDQPQHRSVPIIQRVILYLSYHSVCLSLQSSQHFFCVLFNVFIHDGQQQHQNQFKLSTVSPGRTSSNHWSESSSLVANSLKAHFTYRSWIDQCLETAAQFACVLFTLQMQTKLHSITKLCAPSYWEWISTWNDCHCCC